MLLCPHDLRLCANDHFQHMGTQGAQGKWPPSQAKSCHLPRRLSFLSASNTPQWHFSLFNIATNKHLALVTMTTNDKHQREARALMEDNGLGFHSDWNEFQQIHWKINVLEMGLFNPLKSHVPSLERNLPCLSQAPWLMHYNMMRVNKLIFLNIWTIAKCNNNSTLIK